MMDPADFTKSLALKLINPSQGFVQALTDLRLPEVKTQS